MKTSAHMDFEYNNVRDIYSKICDHFDDTRQYKWCWVEEFLQTFENNMKICDIGCGNGRNMEGHNLDFIGIDNCPEFIEICLKKGLNVKEADVCSLPFKDNTFDGLISIASLHHLSGISRRIDAFNEIYRVLKPGGRCLISVWSKNQPSKTRRKFNFYGENFVEWKNKNGEIFKRYYYIFRLPEIEAIIKLCKLKIEKHSWECGNEVYIISK